jgi:hypothetical protein
MVISGLCIFVPVSTALTVVGQDHDVRLPSHLIVAWNGIQVRIFNRLLQALSLFQLLSLPAFAQAPQIDL